MITYIFRNWAARFENHRSRELKSLNWFAMPNTDEDDYAAIMELPNGPAIYGAGVAILRVASRCTPRGHLLRSDGAPHTAETLARITRMPSKLMHEALNALCSKEIGWLSKAETKPIAEVEPSLPLDPAPLAMSDPMIDLRTMCNNLYGRPPSAHWSYDEESALATIARREEVMDEAETIRVYRAKLPLKDVEFFPNCVGNFLKNWTKTLDQARVKARPAGASVKAARSSVAEANKV